MKRIILITLAGFFLVSCSANKKIENATLGTKKDINASLATYYSSSSNSDDIKFLYGKKVYSAAEFRAKFSGKDRKFSNIEIITDSQEMKQLGFENLRAIIKVTK